jgi:4-nitrophenyl phosphatase
VAFLAEARRRAFPFLLVTNNSTRNPVHVAARLHDLNIPAEPHEILTSSEATAAFIRAQADRTHRVLPVGESGLREALETEGLTVVDTPDHVDWVVVGLDRDFTYARLAAATQAVLGGARFVACNTDSLLPVEGGAFLPGAGSMVAAIHAATGATPTVVGKPEVAMFHHALERMGNPPASDVAMVGDRLDTDVDGARRAGLRTILVLTGVSTAEQAARSAEPPDAVLPDLGAVAGLLGWG